jgi:hypothetical protein
MAAKEKLNVAEPPVEFNDSGKIHTWTIKDAKDGDIIALNSGWTCLFKRIHGVWFSSHCFITSDGEFLTGYERHAIDSKINGDAHPATEDEKERLFKAIKDAGFVWNMEAKKLENAEKDD